MRRGATHRPPPRIVVISMRPLRGHARTFMTTILGGGRWVAPRSKPAHEDAALHKLLPFMQTLGTLQPTKGHA
eukprot:6121706-Prymnesium_polylepis.1